MGFKNGAKSQGSTVTFFGLILAGIFYLNEHTLLLVSFAILILATIHLTRSTENDNEQTEATNKLEDLRDVSNSSDLNYVYLMYDPSLGLHKIGHSKDAIYREKTLQGQRPSIELLSKKQYPSKKKARQIELLLHKKFASKRTRGEWFRLEKNDIDYVEGYLK